MKMLPSLNRHKPLIHIGFKRKMLPSRYLVYKEGNVVKPLIRLTFLEKCYLVTFFLTLYIGKKIYFIYKGKEFKRR